MFSGHLCQEFYLNLGVCGHGCHFMCLVYVCTFIYLCVLTRKIINHIFPKLICTLGSGLISHGDLKLGLRELIYILMKRGQ